MLDNDDDKKDVLVDDDDQDKTDDYQNCRHGNTVLKLGVKHYPPSLSNTDVNDCEKNDDMKIKMLEMTKTK